MMVARARFRYTPHNRHNERTYRVLPLHRRTHMRFVLWPSPWLYAITMVAVAVLGVVQSWNLLFAALSRWDIVTVAVRDGIAMPSLVIAVVGAILGRVYAADHMAVGALAGRGSSLVLRSNTFCLMGAACVGYTVGMMPLVLRTAINQAWGIPDVWAMLAAYAALACVVCLACSWGALLANAWALVLVPAVMLAAMVLPSGLNVSVFMNTGLSSLQPALVWFDVSLPSLGWRTAVQTDVMRIALFSAAGYASMRWAQLRVDQARMLCDIPAWVSTAAVMIMVVSAVWFSPPLVVSDGARSRCEYTNAGITLCLHPADERLRETVSTALDSVAALSTADGWFALESYRDEWWNAPVDEDVEPVYLGFTSTVRPEEISGDVVDAVLPTVSGSTSCPVIPLDNGVSESQEPQTSYAQAVHTTLALRLGGDPSVIATIVSDDGEYLLPEMFGLDALSDDEFALWYAAHDEQILSCQLTTSDIEQAEQWS